MATNVNDLIPGLAREINPPGFEQYPDALPSDFVGYVTDGFWEGRLMGVFEGYTIKDGAELLTPDSGTFITDSTDADFPEPDQMFCIIIAGFRLLQRKALNLAANFRAQAGPVEYEQQVSATVLREILQSLERRLEQYKELYSDALSPDVFYYMDGVAQSSYALVAGLPQLTVR
jgi:hypothetical protein